MTLLTFLIIIIAIICLIVWIFRSAPIPQPYKWIILVALAIAAIYILVSMLGNPVLFVPR